MTAIRKLSLAALAFVILLMSLTALSSQPASAALTGKTAKQISAEMGAGWNLGNTLDATGGSGVSSETSWGNPKTTKAMIDAVKAEGFNTVRIPVSWGRHTSGSNYTIDSAWMARVKEVVDYCIANDMYVILNIHHDNDKNYYYPSSAYKTQSLNFVKSIWKQVSATFKNYDQHLIFETLNEPRLVGTSDEWWFPVNSPNANVKDAISVINELNQASVDVIRASGGNNADRCIMVPGYDASIDGCTTPTFKMPTDSASNRLMVSVHAYTPYNFCLNGSGTSVFSDSLKSEVDYLFDTLNTKFISKNIPVVIGETSASNKGNASERLKWADYFFGKASDLGIPCVLWDNNAYNNSDKGEAHGHLDRKNLSWYDKNFVDRMVQNYLPPTPPANVTGLYLKGKASDALRIAWNKNTSADGYIIEQKVGSTWTRIAKITSNATTEYRISGLKADTDYSFRVKAYKMFGSTAMYSAYTTGTYRTYMSSVSGLYLKGRAADALRLGWNKSSVADGYIIEQQISGKWTRIAKLTSNATTEYRIDGLKAGTAYSFRIKAYRVSGGTAYYSAYSTGTYDTKPSGITGLYLKGRASDALRIAWDKNTSADGYIVEQKVGDTWTRIAKITNNSTAEYRISGLKAGNAYSFRVRSYKMSGTAALYSGYTTGSWRTYPGPITGLTVKGTAADAIRIGWTKNTSADGYIIEQQVGSTWVRVGKITDNTVTELRITGLKKATSYNFRVRTYKMSGSTALYGGWATISAKTK
ncbi:MAG: cellulase family glycosylhydrolase [Eubacterium sp.]|nr:cellulase family glycosylhydrolase [Eubacterium sp.]